MTADLAPRLTALLDVIQRAHRVKRTVAQRIVGDALGVSHRYVSNLATNSVRVGFAASIKLDYRAIEAMERRYARPLQLRRALIAACREAA